MKIIDPEKIDKFPVIVMSDDLRGFFAWGIRQHTSGQYSHIMIMLRPGHVVTQGGTFKEIPIADYMKVGMRLKFWYYNDFTKDEIKTIEEAIHKDLNKNWWFKTYDVLGLFGQLIRIRWIQNPFKNYCSEGIAKYLRLSSKLKTYIPKRPDPAEINKIFKTIISMEVLGYFWMED